MERETCPQCGAAITEEKCPYCGTLFYDFACIDVQKPFWIKVKDGNIVRRMKVCLAGVNYKIETEDCTVFSDNTPYYFMSRPVAHELDMNFRVLPDDDGILAKIVDTDIVDKDTKAW